MVKVSYGRVEQQLSIIVDEDVGVIQGGGATTEVLGYAPFQETTEVVDSCWILSLSVDVLVGNDQNRSVLPR